MRNKVGTFIAKNIMYILLMILMVIMLFPVVYTFLASFKSNQEILVGGSILWPKEFSLENYKQAWVMANFGRYTWNSIYMTFFIVLGTLINSTMGGYVFARSKFPGSKIIFAIFTSTMFISIGSLTIFPLFQIAKFLHINNSLWGVIIIKCFGLHIVNIYLVRSYIRGISTEIDEAAKIDGCSFFRTFYSIMLPLIAPIIATVGLLTFRAAWNGYLLPMVFTIANPDQAPLVVGVVSLKSEGEATSSWNLMLAGTMLSIAPIVIIYLALNKFFIAGLTSGAVKG